MGKAKRLRSAAGSRRYAAGSGSRAAAAQPAPGKPSTARPADDDELAVAAATSWGAVLAFLLVIAGAVAFALASTDLIRRMFAQRFSWPLLDATQKRLSRATYSESSLYYTFMEEYTQAPSFSAAVAGALRDNRTEYPDVINPVSRFNIWQEIAVGQLWRSVPALRAAFPDPLDLMIESIWVMQGVSYVGMILLAWYLGGANLLSLACGFVAIATYASIAATERLNCFRAVQFPMLRENYSVPFMWYQLLLLAQLLRAGAANTLPRRRLLPLLRTASGAGLFVATALMLTGWQFAPFLLLLQVGALLATYIAGYADLRVVAQICKVLGAATTFVGAVVTLGNVMLLTAPVLFVIGAVVVAASRSALKPTSPAEYTSCAAGLCALLRRLALVLGLVALAFCCKFVVMSLVGLQDDAHIINILKFNLSGFSAAYEDFQTLLYLCSGAYQIMRWGDIQFLQDTEALPLRAAAVLGAVTVLVLAELRRRGPRAKAAVDPALVFAVANGILLVALFTLIQRLSSVGVPFLCVVVAQAASPNHFAAVASVFAPPTTAAATKAVPQQGKQEQHKRQQEQPPQTQRRAAAPSGGGGGGGGGWSLLRLAFVGVGLAVAALCSQQAYASLTVAHAVVLPKASPPVQPRISKDMQAADKLIRFVQSSIPPTAALGGDAPILSRIRLMAHRPILNHPHAEHKARRVREEQLYQVFNRWSEKEVWDQLRKLKADYFVFSLGPCNLQCTLPNGRHFDMVYLVNATNSLGEVGRGRAEVEQFCFWVYTQQHFLTYFKLVHDGMPFWVIKVLTPSEVDARKAEAKLKRKK